MYCVCSGPWPFNLSCRPFLFDWVGVLWPQLSEVLKLVRWARRVLSPVSLQLVQAAAYAPDSGESL